MLGAVLVILLVVPVHITFQSLKQAIGPGIGFHADLVLHRADVWLHGGPAWQWFGIIVRISDGGAHPRLPVHDVAAGACGIPVVGLMEQ
jgi:hypothetical protein